MDVCELPFLHLAGGPGRRLLYVRRIGQTRTIDIAQVAHDVHHLRMIETFILDLIDAIQIGLARRLRRQRQDH